MPGTEIDRARCSRSPAATAELPGCPAPAARVAQTPRRRLTGCHS